MRSMLYSYRNQSTDLQRKSVDWFLCECNIRLIYKWIDWFLYECNIDMIWVNNVQVQKQPPEVFFCRIDRKHFAKLTGKHLYQSLFLVKLQDSDLHAFSLLWSIGLVLKALDSQSRGPVFKTSGWLQGRLSISSFRGW